MNDDDQAEGAQECDGEGRARNGRAQAEDFIGEELLGFLFPPEELLTSEEIADNLRALGIDVQPGVERVQQALDSAGPRLSAVPSELRTGMRQ